MKTISKAIAAGVGGAAAGAVTLPFVMPEGAPWYAPVIAWAAVILLPALAAYIAPKNAG